MCNHDRAAGGRLIRLLSNAARKLKCECNDQCSICWVVPRFHEDCERFRETDESGSQWQIQTTFSRQILAHFLHACRLFCRFDSSSCAMHRPFRRRISFRNGSNYCPLSNNRPEGCGKMLCICALGKVHEMRTKKHSARNMATNDVTSWRADVSPNKTHLICMFRYAPSTGH